MTRRSPVATHCFSSAASDVYKGRVALGLIPSMATAWLVPRLPAFLATHPELGLNLQSSTHVVDFEREPVDLALRLGGGRWANVHAEFLFPEWITPVASPALLKPHGRPAPDQMARLPLLGDPANRWKDWFEHFGGQPPARYVAQFDDTETLHQAAAQGVGVVNGGYTYDSELIEALPSVRPGTVVAELDADTVTAHLDGVEPGVELLLTGFLAAARAKGRCRAGARTGYRQGKRGRRRQRCGKAWTKKESETGRSAIVSVCQSGRACASAGTYCRLRTAARA